MKENSMQNVYDIKRKENLNYILPLRSVLPFADKSVCGQAVIVIHLFYEDSLDYYLRYVDSIPEEIHILFTSSNTVVLERLEEHMESTAKTYRFIKKKNRGRDVSGLLVACREEILKYRYICFLHDKKEKNERLQKDTEAFVRCLWENMIGSSDYILNILQTFQENDELGVLFPPECISENFSYFYDNTWYVDFELMQSLARRLKLDCDLDEEKKPLSLGTVFWAKVDALRKLFAENWSYEDFADEPLPSDGTFSHAVERCFAYVAQDAGYKTGIVMTDQFAGERIDYVQDVLTDAFKVLKACLGIGSVKGLRKSRWIDKKLVDFALEHSPIYIYGAGKYGQRCADILYIKSCEVKAFIVSKKENGEKKIKGIPVIEVSQFVPEENSGIIVAVSEKFREEILNEMKERYPSFEQMYCFGEMA